MNSRRRQQVINASRRPTAVNAVQSVAQKFARLAQLRQQINSLKDLYAQHDALQSELLQLFITTTDTQFAINRQLTIGNRTYRLTPYFYDERKSTIKAKTWKSTAHETFTIE